MKTHWVLIIFAAGIGAGWLMFGGGVREGAEAAGNKSAAPVVRRREPRPVTTPHESKFSYIAKKLHHLTIVEEEAFKKSLAPGDHAAAIDALLAQTGPEGLPENVTSMLCEIVKAWAHEDFDGAWAWSRRIVSDASRKFVASLLLNELGDKDPARALALYVEMAAENPGFRSNIPSKMIELAASKDAASFLDLLGKLPEGSGFGGDTDFAADFDFQQAADGITTLPKNGDGRSHSQLPHNFLSTWAALDADAAYAWYSKNPNALTYESFESLLVGIEKQGTPGASSAWAADKLSESGADRDAMIHSLTKFRSDRRRTNISSIAQAMPDTASRDRFLGDVVTKTTFYYPPAEFDYALTQMSSPTARLEILRQLGAKGHYDKGVITDARLQQWGLTRQQVEQIPSFDVEE